MTFHQKLSYIQCFAVGWGELDFQQQQSLLAEKVKFLLDFCEEVCCPQNITLHFNIWERLASLPAISFLRIGCGCRKTTHLTHFGRSQYLCWSNQWWEEKQGRGLYSHTLFWTLYTAAEYLLFWGTMLNSSIPPAPSSHSRDLLCPEASKEQAGHGSPGDIHPQAWRGHLGLSSAVQRQLVLFQTPSSV